LKNLIARVLVVEDFEPWRRFICSSMRKEPGLTIVGQVADGEEAVQAAEQLQPDLILLDIGLPRLDGLAAAKRILETSAKSRILFCTENRSLDVAQWAMQKGASGYILKQDAGSQLLVAIEAVLDGRRFLSSTLTRHLAKAEAQPSRTQPGRFASPRSP
jgi:DNA-binding NarL/FixJ family response regulator